MKHVTFYLFLFLTFAFSSVLSATHARDIERVTSVRILQESGTIEGGKEYVIATEIILEPEWHVYWRNPGDSGLPVRISWDAPEGFEFSEIEWPTPKKITYDFLANYGYYDHVTLLQTVSVPKNIGDEEITLTARVDMLVCHEICIPENDTVSARFNGVSSDINHSDLIDAAKTSMPQIIEGTFTFSEQTEGENKNFHLTLSPQDTDLFQGTTPSSIEFFPYDWGILNHVAAPKVMNDNGVITLSHARGDEPIDQKESLSGVLIISDKKNGNKGFQITAQKGKSVTKGAAAPVSNGAISETNIQTDLPLQTSSPNTTWFSAIYLALFGGLILNLMPCVFPVLSMKALSLVKMQEKEARQARTYGLAYTFGVILSFLAIGGTLLILKEAGAAIGWGFQLQNPIVVAALAYLLFAIGLNLIGFFEFDFGLNNIGNKLTQGQSVGSSFFTGILATIVATPCTAPFMGAAMGFAIAQPALVSMSVFAALGFGLALPYLLLSFIPALRNLLPRPGAWMNTFKQFLAFPMLASSVWLIWVLDQQSGAFGVLLTLLGMLSIAFAIWLSHLKPTGFMKTITRTLFVLCLIVPLINLSYITTSMKNDSGTQEYSKGKTFSEETLETALTGENPVFVEMTAAWCITCKVNSASSINVQSTKDVFAEHKVEYLIGDWTNHDEKITEYLQTFNRNGVPIYVFYGKPDEHGVRPSPVLLPQILTPTIVQNTIEGSL
ncbi:MAG: protein-disulfide reductase DsbD family protein [Alphaproteobacteria bacterium]